MKVSMVSYTQVTKKHIEKLIQESKKNEKLFLKNIENPEALIAYIARVSSLDQKNSNYSKLLKYCLNHGHWSPFEMVDVTFEIETTRAISAQLIRHKSLVFQEFSLRYQKVDKPAETVETRLQDKKNRQNSLETSDSDLNNWFKTAQKTINNLSFSLYEESLEKGIAKEQARYLLPLSTPTRLYAKGSLRSWIHYVQVRAHPDTQKEHREIALEIKKQLSKQFPIVAEALDWEVNG